MIANWRMNYFPSIENERRYKIKIKGKEEDVSSLMQKIGDICGKPSQLDDEDYNWVFYVYKVKAEMKSRIKTLLIDMEAVEPEIPDSSQDSSEAATKKKDSVISKPVDSVKEEVREPEKKIQFESAIGEEVEEDKKEVISKPVIEEEKPEEKTISEVSPARVEGSKEGKEEASGFGGAAQAAEPGKKEEASGFGGAPQAAELEKKEEASGFGGAPQAAEPGKKEEVSGFGGAPQAAEPEKKEEVSGFGGAPQAAEPGKDKEVALAGRIKETGLVETYTFDKFVVGASNRFAHAAAQAVSKNPGNVYNPLFLYGGVGLGKTHLMHAIGHHMLENTPEKKMLYITTEKFISEVIEAISNGTIQDLRDKYRELDLLMIDDIQFLAEAESTQEDFFHTFNVLHNSHKQIVITSDKPPKQLTTLEDRLKSRFEWGLIADVKTPDLETRMAILKKKEEYGKLKIDDSILAYIAGRLKSNIRELEGFLKRIYAYAQMTKQKVDMELVKELMNDLLPEDEKEGVKEATLVAEEVKKKPSKAEAIAKLRELSKPEPKPEKAASGPVEEKEPKTASSEKPASPTEKKDKEGGGKLSRPMEIAYFYPQGHEEENQVMKEYFNTTSEKHKLKFSLTGVFDREYDFEEKINYAMFAELCKTNNLKNAIILGPPPDGELSHDAFSEQITTVLEEKGIAVQIIPFDELRKEYKYLNLLLDMVLIGHKNIFSK